MDVKQMVFVSLKLRDCDGLRNDSIGCTCGMNDLFNCGGPVDFDSENCMARVKSGVDAGNSGEVEHAG